MVKLSGTLKITVKAGQGLQDMDWWAGASDPYLQVLLDGTEVFSTGWKENTGNPYWNDSHTCLVNKYANQLKFVVWDRDVGAADDKLGTLTFSAHDIRDNKKDGWQNLAHGEGGKINLSIEFKEVTFDSHIF